MVGLLAISWRRARAVLHPHFMFCLMLFVIASDFMIRGYDDPNLQGIPLDRLITYQLETLAVLVGIGIATLFIRKPYEVGPQNLHIDLRIAPSVAVGVMLVAVFIALLQQYFRLVSVDWSFDELVNQMLGPRDSRSWQQPVQSGSRNATYELINGLIPLVAISFAYLLFSRIWYVFVPALLGFVLVMAVLITDGSRTEALIPLASLGMFAWVAFRGKVARTIVAVSLGFVAATIASLLVVFRAQGLGTAQNVTLTYHQDDSIYRIWAACAYADFTAYRWDWSYFFFYIAALPVPRSLWPSKPILDENFYGVFKLYYVTTTFMGEWVAIAGSVAGFIFSFVFGVLLYRFFYYSQNLLRQPLGLPAYLLVSLYCYMIMRSMPNITIFVYAPAAAVMMTLFATVYRKRRLRTHNAVPGASVQI